MYTMTLAQRRNRLTTNFSERIPVVKWRPICTLPANVRSTECFDLSKSHINTDVADGVILFLCLPTHHKRTSHREIVRLNYVKRRFSGGSVARNRKDNVTRCHNNRTGKGSNFEALRMYWVNGAETAMIDRIFIYFNYGQPLNLWPWSWTFTV